MCRHQDTFRNNYKSRNRHDNEFSNPNKHSQHTGKRKSKVNTFVGKPEKFPNSEYDTGLDYP